MIERATAFGLASLFFGGLLAATSAVYPPLMPWVIGFLIAGVVFSKADAP